MSTSAVPLGLGRDARARGERGEAGALAHCVPPRLGALRKETWFPGLALRDDGLRRETLIPVAGHYGLRRSKRTAFATKTPRNRSASSPPTIRRPILVQRRGMNA